MWSILLRNVPGSRSAPLARRGLTVIHQVHLPGGWFATRQPIARRSDRRPIRQDFRGFPAMFLSAWFIGWAVVSTALANEPVPADSPQPAAAQVAVDGPVADPAAIEPAAADPSAPAAEPPKADGQAIQALMQALGDAREAVAETVVILGGGQPGMPDVDQAQLKQMKQQFLPAYRFIAKTELKSLSDLVAVPEAGREPILAAAEAMIDECAKDMAMMQMGRGVWFGSFQPNSRPEPKFRIQQAIQQAAIAATSEEIVAPYLEFVRSRREYRHQLAKDWLLCQMDDMLFFSEEQRLAVGERIQKLETNWDAVLLVTRYGGRYLPAIPNEELIADFSDDQKNAWKTIQKVDPGGGWWDHQGNPGPPEDRLLWPGTENDAPASALSPANPPGGGAQPAGGFF